jgi:phospholipid-transporting ATPase
MLNSVNAKPKKSRLEVKMSIKIYFIFVILLVLCFGAGLIYVLWMTQHIDEIPYLGITQINFVKDLFIRFGNWFLIVNNIVPISLLVTLEMVKVMQGLFISGDPRMRQVSTDISASVQSSSLNEELGQIDYVFSDKTGTLTQNLMEFKKTLGEWKTLW